MPTLESDEKYLYNCFDSVVEEIATDGSSNEEVIAVVKLEKSSKGSFLTRTGKYDDIVKWEFSDGNRSVAKI